MVLYLDKWHHLLAGRNPRGLMSAQMRMRARGSPGMADWVGGTTSPAIREALGVTSGALGVTSGTPGVTSGALTVSSSSLGVLARVRLKARGLSSRYCGGDGG